MTDNHGALVGFAVRQRSMSLVVLIAGVALFPVALLLTVGREPSETIPTTPARPDGCVMFCTDVETGVSAMGVRQ